MGKTAVNNLELVSAFSMYKKQHSVSDPFKRKKQQTATPKKQKLKQNGEVKQHAIIKKSKKLIEKRKEPKLKKLKKLSGGTNGTAVIVPSTTDTVQISINGCKKLDSSDDPLLDALQTFKWMIEPLSPEVFFKTYWEQKVLHIRRVNASYYNHVFNSTIFDKIIRNNHLYYTQNVDVVSYENGVKEVHNPEGRASASALWDYYSNGCSIRILNPQTYCNKVHLLLATLQEYFGTMVGANVYLTPPNSQGFAPHFDDIEAFVIQLEGRKHWKLYQPKDSDVLARFSSPNFTHKELGDPFMELSLNAGEVLYFPRGTIHEGRTDSNSHSLHITVSVYQQTSYADLLQYILPEALKKASANDLDFRRGLPLHYLKHFGAATRTRNSECKTSIKNKIANLVQELVNYIDADSAADQLGRKFMYDSMPPVLSKTELGRCSKADGAFLDNGRVINRVGIDLDTKVRLLRYYCIRLVLDSDATPKLYYNTENANVYHGQEEQWLELDPSMVSSVHMLQNTYPRYIEVDKLPMEAEELKLQLISDLWEHGLIVTEQRLKPIDN